MVENPIAHSPAPSTYRPINATLQLPHPSIIVETPLPPRASVVEVPALLLNDKPIPLEVDMAHPLSRALLLGSFGESYKANALLLENDTEFRQVSQPAPQILSTLILLLSVPPVFLGTYVDEASLVAIDGESIPMVMTVVTTNM